MILSVLDVAAEGFQVFFGHQKQLPWLVCSNIVVASNVQLGWFTRFAMECFNPYPLAPNSIWLNI
jgi:hypothetical protein